MAGIVPIRLITETAAGLLTEPEDSNPEYDRALVELICMFLPGDTDSNRADVQRRLYLYARLDRLPPGSVVTTPFPDLEGNIAERTSDRRWLVTGEENLYDTYDLIDSADGDFAVLRHGFSQ